MVTFGNCTRCDHERKRVAITSARGHTLPLPADFKFELPKTEHVCGDCLTGYEIFLQLGPAVEFVLGVLIDSTTNAESKVALEFARAHFMVRNLDPDKSNRAAAIRALGLGDDR